MNGSSNSDAGGLILGLALIALMIGFYFLPSIIASMRNHSNSRSILVLNIFLGWTFIGWIIALIWAFSDNTLEPDGVSHGETVRPGIWGLGAVFAAIAVIAIGLVIHRGRTQTNIQEVTRVVAPVSPTPESESSNSTISADVEGFKKSRSNPGFQTYTNSRYGFRVDCPASFIPQQPPQNGDGLSLKSEDGKATLTASGMNNSGFTLKDEFDRSIKDVQGQLGYNTTGRNWFVVTWTDGESMGYTKEFVGPSSMNSFTFTFPVEQRLQYDSVITTIEKSFKPGDIDSSH